MKIDLEAMKAAALAAQHGADPEHPWELAGHTAYQLEHAGWRRGVEQFQNRIYASVQRGPNTTEAQANAVAAHIVAAQPAVVLALIERLERAENVINNPRLTGLTVHDNLVSMGLEGAACQAFAEAFAEQFRRAGSVNYLEMSFDHSDAEIGPLVVTVQRSQGKTPGALRAEAETRAERAEAEAVDLRAAIRKQAAAATMGMDEAKRGASIMLKRAEELHGQSNPDALASERAANAMLTEENERLRAELEAAEERNRIYRRMTGYCVGGEKLTREEYPGLFSAADEAAKNYTGGDFKLPDLKGQFIKGQS
ncbi:hypothetical protein [Bordetella phage vB_BbrM_PHB04]|uniref:Uncharacterized protein n=1 Tax=Bordetella phage vB_BbrM_PHB04 TaxID=2029657 RepID=A0A291L9X9_9CAUD|nr:hypothetical protein HOS14_gp052 [Bordetella phage vB_BbrM_PHB04]ATI15670.1 hypothetical protein [Bordetella phage vB_BbrM_PHB04]